MSLAIVNNAYFLLLVLFFGFTEEDPDDSEFYVGVDVSYLNEMIDCGATFRENGDEKNPYDIFANNGMEIARIRLWHTPNWTNYSDIEDASRSIKYCKERGMKVLLDLHYSDTWAHPFHQIIPEAWKGLDDKVLGDSVYAYTYEVLNYLQKKGLTPELIQVGNETNSEVMVDAEVEPGTEIDWDRNIFLLNQGLQAVQDFNQNANLNIESMLHIAQPENAEWWFKEAMQRDIKDFEWIGLSYYSKWSTYDFKALENTIVGLKADYKKSVMVVETAYPYSIYNFDNAANLLGEDALVEGYEASVDGQEKYLKDLKSTLVRAGANGLIYWEGGWISSKCKTLWGTGSHWENATFFDAANNNELLPSIRALSD